MTCLCTGCWLYDPPHRRRVRGDLHALGERVLIFNACTTSAPPVEAAWEGNVVPPDPEVDRAVILMPFPQTIFERRGVFTLVGCTLTPALVHYTQDEARAFQKKVGL